MERKNYLNLAFVGLLLCATGCGGNKPSQSQKEKDKAYADSINAEVAAREAVKKVQDSLCVNVWGDVKFGMTIEEVSATNVFGQLKGNEEFYEVDVKKVSKELGTKYLRKVTLRFTEGERRLERIIFDSENELKPEQFPDMINDCHLIAAKIESGFQTKFEWEKDTVTTDDFNGSTFVVSILSLYYGNATVIANISPGYSENFYNYGLVVNHNEEFE